MNAIKLAVAAVFVFGLSFTLLVGFWLGNKNAAPSSQVPKAQNPQNNKYAFLLLDQARPDSNLLFLNYHGRIKELSSERLVLQDLNDPKKIKTIPLGPAVTSVLTYETTTGSRSASPVAKTDFRLGTEVSFSITADIVQDKILSATLQISPQVKH